MAWPFRKAPEPEVVEPQPEVHPRVCARCGSELFTVTHGLYERGDTLSISPPRRAKCVRCGTRVDDSNWSVLTRRLG